MSIQYQGVRVRKIVERDFKGKKSRFVISTHNKYFITGTPQTIDGVDMPTLGAAVNNIYLNGSRIASVDSAGNGAWFLANHVDSVKAVIDDNGAVVSRTEYLPYGETFVESGTKVLAPKYNGQALDEESNLYYFNARHYDPEIARFVTADSVTDGPTSIKGWNRYMYVGGNPIMYTDPTGHERRYEGSLVNELYTYFTGGKEAHRQMVASRVSAPKAMNTAKNGAVRLRRETLNKYLNNQVDPGNREKRVVELKGVIGDVLDDPDVQPGFPDDRVGARRRCLAIA